VLMGLVLGLGAARGHPLGWLVLLEGVKLVVLPWLVGRWTTDRRAYLDDLIRQAENARRDTREAAERAVAEDRGAIARDLHDVISHHVSAINVHAGAARLQLSTVPSAERATASLRAVESASRAALSDLRGLLALLHREHPGEHRQPGLANIDELLAGFRAADRPVRLRTDGDPRPMDSSTDIALYRIAQEMLTNALRHGNGDPIELMLSYGDERFELAAANGVDPGDSADPARDRPRLGLAGIRDRARIFDGELVSGPGPGGRSWRTAVSFAWPARERPEAAA
jgi:signal transduction histidine kinase